MQLFTCALSLILLAIPTVVLSQSSSRCVTPIGERGLCVAAGQCQFVRDLVTVYGRNIPRSIQDQVRQMQCNGQGTGFHLCCPNPSVISAHSDTPSEQPRRKNSVTVRQTSQDLNRIDPHGLEVLNSVKDCGKKSNIKLSNGEVTKIGEFPWLVLLKYETSGRPFLCGGSLITDRFVLTAAHCTTSHAKMIGVRMGEHDLDKDPDCQFLGGRRRDCLPPFEEFGIEAIRAHPNYKDKSIDSDIALIKLDRPVQFKTHIKPVCLPIEKVSQDIAYDQDFFIAGWGTTEKNVASSVLLKAVVNRKDLSVCRNYYIDAPVTEKHICAAGDGLLHTCRGDSGGPLFFRHPFKQTVRYVQYGVTSYGGTRCGVNQKQPGVFSNVITLLPWITQNLY